MDNKNEISKFLSISDIIKINSLEKNSLIVFRVPNVTDGVYAAIDNLKSSFGKLFIEKNINFLILKPETDITVLKEDGMAELGWVRKTNVK